MSVSPIVCKWCLSLQFPVLRRLSLGLLWRAGKSFHQCWSWDVVSAIYDSLVIPDCVYFFVSGISHHKVSWCFKGQVVASDQQFGLNFFVGETEDCVSVLPYVTVDQPITNPLLDLPECFFHPDNSCSHVCLWAPDDQIFCIDGAMDPERDVFRISLMKIITSVGESTPPCGASRVFFLLFLVILVLG